MQDHITDHPRCIVDGCERLSKSRNPRVPAGAYCGGHYQRVKKFGDPRADEPLKVRGQRTVCTVDGCERSEYARGLCDGHWQQQRAGREFTSLPARPPCIIEGCERSRYARDWCQDHYSNWHRCGNPLGSGRPQRVDQPCSVEGCGRPQVSKGYCKAHHKRWYLTGDARPEEPIRPVVNRAGDWFTDRDGYRRKWLDGRHVLEHRLVMVEMLGRDLLPGETVHHLNGDRADNRPANLELWISGHRPGQRVQDRVADAVRILQLYGPEHLGPAQQT